MATIGSLHVNLLLNVSQFNTQINQAAQATARATRQMQSSLTTLERNLHRVGRAIGTFITVGLLANTVRAVGEYADAWKLATNQVAAANTIAELQARSMEGINQIASETRTSISETAELYGKLLRSTVGVAQSEIEVAKATELVNKAFKAGGASMQEQVNGIRQLAQSLSSGIFQGDELRSIRENAPLLAKAIAEEFNTTIGGLKKLGAEGKLTADRVFAAILKGAKPIEDAFGATNATIADSFTILNNAITQYVGQTDKAYGISKGIAETIKIASTNFRDLADSIFSSNGEIERLIRNWKELREATKQNIFGKGEEGAKEIAAFKKHFEELQDFITSSENPIGNAINRIFGGLAHPFNAFLRQINGAIEGWNFFKTEISKFPTVGEFAEFLGMGELKDQIVELVTGVASGLPQYFVDIGREAMKAEKDVKRITAAVETFNASQSRGRPEGTFAFLSQFLKDRGGRGFEGLGVGGVADTKEFRQAIIDFKQEVQGATGDLDRLTAAAAKGQDAFDLMKRTIEAENAAIKLSIPLHTQQADEFIAWYVTANQAKDSISGLIDRFEAFTEVIRETEQLEKLNAALRISTEEFHKARIAIEAYNWVIALGGDGTTEFEKGLMALKEELIRSGEEFDRTKEKVDELAGTINSTINSAISSVASAFADAVVEGENFREMLDALLKDLAKLAINSVFQLFLKQIIGSVGTTGAPGTGLLGNVNVGAMHGGGIVGQKVGGRSVPAAAFIGAPRFHSGFAGGEFPTILQRGEAVFTKEQLKAIGGGTTNNFTVINQVPNTSVTEERRDNNTGGQDVTAFIRQTMTKEIGDPASSVNKQLRSQFGLSQAGIRR